MAIPRWLVAAVAMLLLHAPAVAVAAPDTPGGTAAVRPVGGEVIQVFRPPASPYGPGHRGVDLAADGGAPVRAAMEGTVVFAGLVAGRGWITVDHGGGLDTTYGVLGAWQVRPGQRVDAGEVLGTLAEGATHLDWGARLGGTYVDPLALLGRWEVHLVDPDRLVDPPPPVVDPRMAPGPGPAGLTWPTPGRISSRFGPRVNPVTGRRAQHAGVDVAAPSGTPIVAAADGVVTYAGPRGAYGLLVIIDHGAGVETRYAHASSIAVSVGQPVHQGQVIARVGSTGRSTGPHLHFEVRVGGRPRDPLTFF